MEIKIEQLKKQQEEINQKKRNSFFNMVTTQIKVYEQLKQGVEQSIPVIDKWNGKVCNQRLVTDLQKKITDPKLRYELTRIDEYRFRLRIEEWRTSCYHSEILNKDISISNRSTFFHIITTSEGRVADSQTIGQLFECREQIQKEISDYQTAFLLYDKAMTQWKNLVRLAEEYKKNIPVSLQGKIELKEKNW